MWEDSQNLLLNPSLLWPPLWSSVHEQNSESFPETQRFDQNKFFCIILVLLHNKQKGRPPKILSKTTLIILIYFHFTYNFRSKLDISTANKGCSYFWIYFPIASFLVKHWNIIWKDSCSFILCKLDIKDNSGAVNGKFIGAEAQKFHLTTLSHFSAAIQFLNGEI